MLQRMEYFKIKKFKLYPSQHNDLLPKIEELQIIAKSTNTAVIGTSESKLDESVLEP